MPTLAAEFANSDQEKQVLKWFFHYTASGKKLLQLNLQLKDDGAPLQLDKHETKLFLLVRFLASTLLVNVLDKCATKQAEAAALPPHPHYDDKGNKPALAFHPAWSAFVAFEPRSCHHLDRDKQP